MGIFLEALYILTNLVYNLLYQSHFTQFSGRQRFVDNIIGVTGNLAFRVSGQWKPWADVMGAGGGDLGKMFAGLLFTNSTEGDRSCLGALCVQLPSGCW